MVKIINAFGCESLSCASLHSIVIFSNISSRLRCFLNAAFFLPGAASLADFFLFLYGTTKFAGLLLSVNFFVANSGSIFSALGVEIPIVFAADLSSAYICVVWLASAFFLSLAHSFHTSENSFTLL